MKHKIRKKEMSKLERVYQFSKSVNDAAEVSRECYEKTENPMFKISRFLLIGSLIAFGLGVMMTLVGSVNKSSTL